MNLATMPALACCQLYELILPSTVLSIVELAFTACRRGNYKEAAASSTHEHSVMRLALLVASWQREARRLEPFTGWPASVGEGLASSR